MMETFCTAAKRCATRTWSYGTATQQKHVKGGERCATESMLPIAAVDPPGVRGARHAVPLARRSRTNARAVRGGVWSPAAVRTRVAVAYERNALTV